jgi:hypothetical protein
MAMRVHIDRFDSFAFDGYRQALRLRRLRERRGPHSAAAKNDTRRVASRFEKVPPRSHALSLPGSSPIDGQSSIYGGASARHLSRQALAYGPLQTQVYRQVARMLAKVLRGAKPADLPVEQPTMFELAINLETAKTIGLTLPMDFSTRHCR